MTGFATLPSKGAKRIFSQKRISHVNGSLYCAVWLGLIYFMKLSSCVIAIRSACIRAIILVVQLTFSLNHVLL